MCPNSVRTFGLLPASVSLLIHEYLPISFPPLVWNEVRQWLLFEEDRVRLAAASRLHLWLAGGLASLQESRDGFMRLLDFRNDIAWEAYQAEELSLAIEQHFWDSM